MDHDRKSEIMDVAHQLFREKGYAAVSIKDIAKGANLVKSTLYHHFPNGKEEIYKEVQIRSFHYHNQGLEHKLAELPTSATLYQRLESIVDWFISQPAESMISMMQHDMLNISAESRGVMYFEVYNSIFRVIQQVFDRAIEKGEIVDYNSGYLTGAVISLIDGTMVVRELQDPMKRKIAILDLISILIRGLQGD